MIDNRYQPAEIEARIAAAWEAAQAFRAGRPERRAAKPYCIVIPPPNVTGSLHMGHALNNTLQDVLCRFERMRGADVLWQPGTDHAGIATQMVVERQMMERQEPDRRAIGREKFLEKVWTWKAESGGTIVNQLKRLGASCDWSRERFTMDEGLSRAVLKVFVDLYRADLIYKDKRLVNWDPKLLTAISDLEVEQVEVKGSLWHIKYPIEGSDEFIIVATTRPETMLGDTAVAVHPQNERLKHLIGKHAILPLVGRRIPIIGDDYADPEKGTGAVKITPAHDFNDFEVGQRHHLPQINVLNVEGNLALKENAAFVDGVPSSAELDETMTLHGDERFRARKVIVARLEAAGLMEKIEPHIHVVPHGDRSGVVIEPFLTDQWYVDAKTLAQPAIAAVRNGTTTFVPKNWEKTYFEWMENIQPWCVSRQLWWGHRIPAWYGPDDKVFVAASADEALADALAYYVVKGVLSQAEADAIAQSAERRASFLTRDEDVLDTWFSSALWPFSTLGWPDATPELKRYYPTNVLVTGFDIIFFWVARMMMMGLQFMQEIPFATVYIHALVRDEKGAKMSKSKGNVMDPLDIIDGVELAALIEKRAAAVANKADATRITADTKRDYPKGIPAFGADALRFTLAAMAAQGRDIKLSLQRVEGYRNFATKLWNACRFAEMNQCVAPAGFDPRGAKETLNRWIAHEAARRSARRYGRHRGLQIQRGGRCRSTALSGTSIATGISSLSSRCSPGRTARPRARRAPWSLGCATVCSRCCIRSCRSSPRSCGPSRRKVAPARDRAACARAMAAARWARQSAGRGGYRLGGRSGQRHPFGARRDEHVARDAAAVASQRARRTKLARGRSAGRAPQAAGAARRHFVRGADTPAGSVQLLVRGETVGASRSRA